MKGKVIRFLIKEIKIDKYYRFTLATHLISLLISLLIFFFIDRYFKTKIQNHLSAGMDYFSYVFASFIIFNYSGGNSTIINRINFDINSGVFEFIINSKGAPLAYMICLWIYSFIVSTIQGVFYISLAVSSGVIKTNINLPSLLLLFLISSAVFSAISFIASSFIIVFRRGDLLSFIISSVESILGGVYVPTSVFGKMEIVSEFIPLTHSIRGAQAILYKNASLVQIKEFYILLLFALLLIPTSFLIFKKAINISRRLGNLSLY